MLAAGECLQNRKAEPGLRVGPAVQPMVPTGTTVGAGVRAREPAGVTVRGRVGRRPGSEEVLALVQVPVPVRGLVRGPGLDMVPEAMGLAGAGTAMELVQGIRVEAEAVAVAVAAK